MKENFISNLVKRFSITLPSPLDSNKQVVSPPEIDYYYGTLFVYGLTICVSENGKGVATPIL
jgi:hypothetical protein